MGKLELAQYREVAAFAQFGSDLDAATQHQLNRGARLQELLKQPQYEPLPVEEQVVAIFAGVRGFLDKVELNQVSKYQEQWLKMIRDSHQDILEDLRAKQELTKDTDEKLT